MGQKTHPVGFRLSITKNWQSAWFDDRHYTDLLHEDLQIKKVLEEKIKNAGLQNLEIERSINDVTINLWVAKPGIVIGRGGSGIESLKQKLQKIVSGKLKLNVNQVQKPDLSAKLLAENIARQIERRYPYKRAAKQALQKTMDAGAKGVRVSVAGRLAGTEIARTEHWEQGSVPTQTLKAKIDFAREVALTKYGTIGVKVWIYKE